MGEIAWELEHSVEADVSPSFAWSFRTDIRDDLSKYLRLAVDEEIVITRHGRAAGILIGFASEDDWIDYRLEHHPEFLRRIAEARAALRERRGTPLRELR
jgi:prevent-host-death family protein